MYMLKRNLGPFASKVRNIAFFTGVAVAFGLLTAFTLIIQRSALVGASRQQQRLVGTTRLIMADMNNVLRQLKQHAIDSCDTNNLNYIRDLVLKSRYVREVGIFNKSGELFCTTTRGLLLHPISPPSGGYRSSPSRTFWADLVLIATPGNVRTSVLRDGQFSVVLDPYVLDQLFRQLHGVVWLKSGSRLEPLLINDRKKLALMNPSIWLHQAHPQLGIHTRGLSGWVVTPLDVPGYVLTSYWTFGRMLRQESILAMFLSLIVLLAATLTAVITGLLLGRVQSLDSRIRRLCKEENIRCLYQPIIDIDSHEVVGCEVLMRLLDHGSTLAPDTILPLVRKNGLSWEFDRLVASVAMMEIAHHHDDLVGLEVGFNLMPEDAIFSRAGVYYQSLIERHRLDGLIFNIEITEQGCNGNVPKEAHLFKAAGFRISVDDFGTGQSNLSRVSKLRPDVLKLDKLFIADIDADQNTTTLIPEIISIARAIGAVVVAEGVERYSQLEILDQLKVQRAQGFLLARPMSIHDLAKFVRNSRAQKPKNAKRVTSITA